MLRIPVWNAQAAGKRVVVVVGHTRAMGDVSHGMVSLSTSLGAAFIYGGFYNQSPLHILPPHVNTALFMLICLWV